MSTLSVQTQAKINPESATQAAVPQPRLVKAAHEFEAAMMKELMTQLQPKADSLDGGDDEAGSSDALRSFASDALGKVLSERGGFGIASRIIQQLTPQSNHSGNSPVPVQSKMRTVDSGFK